MIQVIGDNDLATLPTTGSVGKVLRRLKIFKRTCVTAAAPLPSRRSAKPVLAEGKKSADVKHNGSLPPPSANSKNWRRGSSFPRKTPLFANFRPHLAEGVKFPEKMQGLCLLRRGGPATLPHHWVMAARHDR